MTDGEPLAPLYPSATRAKGWRFELDHERIEQSITWALAPIEIRPWLLMLWMAAWKQTPCGSLENDDALIAARIGMPTKLFAKHREVLMRGWCVASDGRLYHHVITERVMEMVEYREKAAARKLEYRERTRLSRESPDPVPRLSRGTPPAATPPEPEPEEEKEKEKHPPPPHGGSRGFSVSSRDRGSGSVHGFPPGFERLWVACPRKVGKDAAAKAFAKRKPDAAMVDAMVAAIEAQKASEQWRKDGGRFIPHPATWLNEGRWMDEPSMPSSDVPSDLAELFRRGSE